jgi:hypothetical protein
MTMSNNYNGWKNYETWNVALWIENDEGLYHVAREFKHVGYRGFVQALRECSSADVPLNISFQTPDGVAWNDSGLDIEALDNMLKEL